MPQVTRRWPIGVAAAVIGLAVLAFLQRTPTPPLPRAEPAAVPVATGGASPHREHVRLPDRRPEEPEESDVPAVVGDVDVDGQPMGGTWEGVDLEAVRAALPSNLYWELSAPTTDEGVIEERERERTRWNVEYGKVLSGTGTEEEIRAYYDYKSRLSADYVELTTHLLDHYKSELPERDVALLQLARRLHLARLEEVPRKLQEAFERKRAQDAARAAWLADEAAFAGDETDSANGQ